MSDAHPEEHEEFIAAEADRAPTTDEERAADDAAREVDVDRVGEHFQEMSATGAAVRGEGEIERPVEGAHDPHGVSEQQDDRLNRPGRTQDR